MEAVALRVEPLLQRVPQVLLVVHEQLRGGRCLGVRLALLVLLVGQVQVAAVPVARARRRREAVRVEDAAGVGRRREAIHAAARAAAAASLVEVQVQLRPVRLVEVIVSGGGTPNVPVRRSLLLLLGRGGHPAPGPRLRGGLRLGHEAALAVAVVAGVVVVRVVQLLLLMLLLLPVLLIPVL